MKQVYQLITLTLSIILYPWLKINKKTRPYLSYRYGFNSPPPGSYVWFHGASLGEVQGILPIIKLLRESNPNQKILGTATSIKGYQKMAELADFASLLPIDHPIYLNKFLKHVKIQKFIFGETEIWPTLISTLSNKEVPIFLVNGRLSEFNFKNYHLFKSFLKSELIKLRKVFCISKTYQQRFIDLGVPPEKTLITGNLKYDQFGKIVEAEDAAKLRSSIFKNDRPIFIIASIRPGEEDFFAMLIPKYQSTFNIILAPRHPEKFDYFRRYLDRIGANFELKSKLTGLAKSPVLLFDTIGELGKSFSYSQITFIGGSLVSGIGGHNPMEAAPYQSLILMGPEYQNQADCVDLLIKNKAILIVRNEQEISEILDHYLDFLEYGVRAQKTWLEFQNKSLDVFKIIFTDA